MRQLYILIISLSFFACQSNKEKAYNYYEQSLELAPFIENKDSIIMLLNKAIELDSTNEKYFVHVSSINGEIIEGDKVSFELEKGPKGLNAVKVNKL